MADVAFEHASRTYPGTTTPAVASLDLEIADGEFVVLVGPSGSGKSTALRMLAGLEPIDEGRILIGGQDVTDVEPKDRDIAMVFQNYALYPHMTVAENIGFNLRLRRRPKHEIKQRVSETAQLLDLEPYLDRKPANLSGGQRQRVAMGRAIVREPAVFLMDEPLSNLDAQLRVATRAQIASLQRRIGVTTVYVTHDQVEAMTMGDRVAVLRDGLLQQCDSPRALFESPQNVFVAGFIGSPAMNLLDAPLSEDGVTVGPLTISIPTHERMAITNGRVTVGVRPDAFFITSDNDALPATVEVVEELGTDAYVYAESQIEGLTKMLIVRVDPAAVPARGASVRLAIKSNQAHFFDAHTGFRLDRS
jgi:multiple sugar transport system ATP-binding protein